MIFLVRRGHQFSFLRTLQRKRGFADPEFKDNWLALSSDEIIENEKQAGSTYWTTQLFKGFGLEAEAEDRAYAAQALRWAFGDWVVPYLARSAISPILASLSNLHSKIFLGCRPATESIMMRLKKPFAAPFMTIAK